MTTLTPETTFALSPQVYIPNSMKLGGILHYRQFLAMF